MSFQQIIDLIRKPAYKTTEFYVVLVTFLAFVGNAFFNLNLDTDAIVAITGTNSAFIISRGWQKKAALDAVVAPAPTNPADPATDSVPPPVIG